MRTLFIFFLIISVFAYSQEDSLQIRGSGTSTSSVMNLSRNTSKRLALVIGNANYFNNRSLCLNNNCPPINDAIDVGEKLESFNFKTYYLYDATIEEINKKLVEIKEEIINEKYGTFFFYYAGHGFQINRENYLETIVKSQDENINKKESSIPLKAIFNFIDSLQLPMNAVIIDACRNSLKTESEKTEVFAYTEPPSNTLLSLSTGIGRTAKNIGLNGRNGFFTEQLLRNLDQNDLALNEVFNKIKISTLELSAYSQDPLIVNGPLFYLSQSLTPFKDKEKNKWGYKNRLGEVSIKPKYDWVSSFLQQKAIVLEDKNFYYINNKEVKTQITNWAKEIPESTTNNKLLLKLDTVTYMLIDKQQNNAYLLSTGQKAEPYHFLNELFDLPDNLLFKYLPNEKINPIKLIDKSSKEIIQEFQNIQPLENDLFSFNYEYSSGIINNKGEIILSERYDYLKYEDRLIIAENKNSGKYGVVDIKGNIVIPFIYSYIRKVENYFITELIDVNEENPLYGIYDKDNLILPNKYKDIFIYNDHFIVELQNSDRNLYNNKGKKLLNKDFMAILDIDEEFVVVSNTNLETGIVNKINQTIIPLKFYDISLFQENLAVAQSIENMKCGYLNKKNDTIIPFKYIDAAPFYNGFAWVKNANSEWLLINKKDEVQLKKDYRFIIYEDNGYFQFELESGEKGYVDYKGDEIIPAIYDHLTGVQDGYIIATKNKKAIIDLNNSKLTPFIFDNISPNNNSFLLRDGDKYGVFFKSGVYKSPIYSEFIFANSYSRYLFGYNRYLSSNKNLLLLQNNDKIEVYATKSGKYMFLFSLQKTYEYNEGFNHFDDSLISF